VIVIKVKKEDRLMRLKLIGGALAMAVATIFVAASAFAQGMPNPAAWQAFQRNHPQVAAEIRANPEVVWNSHWQKTHPAFVKWAEAHPGDYKALRHSGYFGYGAYDQQHQWRNAQWWQQNNPTWAREHHPEWWQGQGPMAGPAGWGDYDEHHQWRNAEWWRTHNPNWVKQHHPNWMTHQQAVTERHQEHRTMKEQQHQEHRTMKEQQHQEHQTMKEQKHQGHQQHHAEHQQQQQSQGH
jgi:hypothetical protein